VESVSVSKRIAFLAAYPGERFLSLFVQQIKAGRLLTCIDRRIVGLGCEVLQIFFPNATIWDCLLDIKKTSSSNEFSKGNRQRLPATEYNVLQNPGGSTYLTLILTGL
jgi:hypothetical protein